MRFDLEQYLHRQIAWSTKTFGPHDRTKGVLDHIRKELIEIEKAPHDLEEWVDLAILAFDGAWRNGHTPAEICSALSVKLAKNEQRDWPDWRTMSSDVAIEHVRGDELLVHLDSSERDPALPELDQIQACPDHPQAEPLLGYGLGGGGVGPYTFCSECGKILSKSEDPEL